MRFGLAILVRCALIQHGRRSARIVPRLHHTSAYCTIRVTVPVWVSLPDTPVTVTV
jgi:hypothetical protein